MEHGSGAGSDVLAASWLAVRTTAGDDRHTYELYDRAGSRLGVIYREDIVVPRTVGKKVVDWTLEWALPKRVYDTVRLKLVMADETPMLTVVFPGEDRERRAVVSDPAGREAGAVVKAKGMHKIHFDLMPGGATGAIGATIDCEDRWGLHFRVDLGGATIGRITNSGAKAHFGPPTTKEYLLELDRPVDEPLRTLLIGALVGMDVSLTPPSYISVD